MRERGRNVCSVEVQSTGFGSCPNVHQEGSNTQRTDRVNPRQSTTGGSRPRVPARVYAIDQYQVPDLSEVVEGTIPIFHRLTKILIDPGSTHSFVTPTFIYGIDVKLEQLSYDLEVGTLIGDQRITTNTIYKNCEICIGERKL